MFLEITPFQKIGFFSKYLKFQNKRFACFYSIAVVLFVTIIAVFICEFEFSPIPRPNAGGAADINRGILLFARCF